MASAIICLILLLLVIYGIRSYLKRLTSGCCGASGQAGVKRIKVKDRNTSHYPHHTVLKVDGMVCQNCAIRVENALNSMEGTFAKVDLSEEKVDVYMKTEWDKETLKKAVKDAGYTVYQVIEG
ncbi:MAG: heavy metal-associated domain-containing protein [bacterium]|nr:heavy metal-associated domain-containing protein [bacterium]